MTCSEAEILLHALLDGELDAGNARDVEAHVQLCPQCGPQLAGYRELQRTLQVTQLRFTAPARLRRRIDEAIPARPAARTSSRRSVLKGFVMGTALSTAMAATVLVAIVRPDQDQRLLGDIVSAHVRSLQADHLTDVRTSDQHTVKPWFNGKVDIAPPVVDLTAKGFLLLGGRLDYTDGQTVASIVYRRRQHVINLFVADGAPSETREPRFQSLQGFNIQRWTARGLEFFAVSDLNAEELREFADKFEGELHPAGRT